MFCAKLVLNFQKICKKTRKNLLAKPAWCRTTRAGGSGPCRPTKRRWILSTGLEAGRKMLHSSVDSGRPCRLTRRPWILTSAVTGQLQRRPSREKFEVQRTIGRDWGKDWEEKDILIGGRRWGEVTLAWSRGHVGIEKFFGSNYARRAAKLNLRSPLRHVGETFARLSMP